MHINVTYKKLTSHCRSDVKHSVLICCSRETCYKNELKICGIQWANIDSVWTTARTAIVNIKNLVESDVNIKVLRKVTLITHSCIEGGV